LLTQGEVIGFELAKPTPPSTWRHGFPGWTGYVQQFGQTLNGLNPYGIMRQESDDGDPVALRKRSAERAAAGCKRPGWPQCELPPGAARRNRAGDRGPRGSRCEVGYARYSVQSGEAAPGRGRRPKQSGTAGNSRLCAQRETWSFLFTGFRGRDGVELLAVHQARFAGRAGAGPGGPPLAGRGAAVPRLPRPGPPDRKSDGRGEGGGCVCGELS